MLERCVDNNVRTTEETINIILNRAFKDSDEFHGMKRNTLKKLLTICTQESHFKFNGKYYDQYYDGVAMDSPLGPLFANIFMNEFEHQSHVVDPDNIEIRDKATCNFKIRLKEELHIITHKPELNSQHAAAYKRKHNKDIFKTIIISQNS